MKKCTRCGEIKKLEEFGVRKSAKDGRKSGCKKCLNKLQKEFYKSEKGQKHYKEYEKSDHRKELRKDPEQIKKKKIAERKPHRLAKKREYTKKRYHTQGEKERLKRWKKDNPEWVRANGVERRARKLNATPDWLTKEQKAEIVEIYRKRQIISDEMGEVYHVDHIVPLRGKDVCGLHVPWNLQIISKTENLEKGNRL